MCQRGVWCRLFSRGQGSWLLSPPCPSAFLRSLGEIRSGVQCPTEQTTSKDPARLVLSASAQVPHPKPGKGVEAGGKWKLVRGSCLQTSANGVLVSVHILDPARGP